MLKNRFLDFFEVKNKISKNPSMIIKILTSQIVRAEKIGLKSFFGKVIRTFCQKSDFSVFEKKIRFFFPNGLKIGFPTNFTILNPNLQKKIRVL
jgi:hypothetical protein